MKELSWLIIALIKKVLNKTISIEHWKLILWGVVFIFLSSFIVYSLEPDEFKSPFNGFWFVMTTISQVGFGDYIPKTNVGRIYTIILYLVGVGFFAIIIAKWIDLLNNYENLKEEEVLGYTGKKHMVMINWSKKSKITIDEMVGKNKALEVVLIDELDQSPSQHDQVHYVQGNAAKKDTLERANVLQAESICIFAPDIVFDEASVDGKTLLIASTIKQLAIQNKADIYIIVEILDEDHISNTNLDCINEFILSNKPFSHLMAETAINKHLD